MSKKDKLSMEQLQERNNAELHSLLGSKAEELRKARFKHAMGQLRETHTLKVLRRDIAKVHTLLARRPRQTEITT